MATKRQLLGQLSYTMEQSRLQEKQLENLKTEVKRLQAENDKRKTENARLRTQNIKLHAKLKDLGIWTVQFD